LEERSREAARYQIRETMRDMAQTYYKAMPEVKELWILLVGKRDLFKPGKINVSAKAADRENLHKINIPIQGGQLWYTNQTTNEIRLEWILPFTAKKTAEDRQSVTKGNPLLEKSFDQAAQWLGRDLITGKPVKLRK